MIQLANLVQECTVEGQLWKGGRGLAAYLFR